MPFTYLGVELSSRGLSFSRHIESRTLKARASSVPIPRPELLSLSTALQLIDLNIVPTACYGIQVIWKYLRIPQLTA